MNAPFPLLSAEELSRLRQAVGQRSEELARELDWLDNVEVVQPATGEPGSADSLKVVVFNAERGNRFRGIRSLLAGHPALRDADVVLLSEVDWGMARSGNRHVARELAQELGLGYAFGVEFLELTKGEAAELEAEGDNTWSFHGNAILSRLPLANARVVRLPRRCSWAAGSQLRIGGRMALVAEIDGHGVPITIASVHLENRTDPHGRREQMETVISALAAGPAIVAGDLNTSTIDAGVDEQIFSVPSLLAENPERLRRPEPWEPLFADMRAAGFLVDELNPPGVPTSVPMGIADPSFWLKLDWIFARGLTSRGAATVLSAVSEGDRVSDHDFLVAQFLLPG